MIGGKRGTTSLEMQEGGGGGEEKAAQLRERRKNKGRRKRRSALINVRNIATGDQGNMPTEESLYLISRRGRGNDGGLDDKEKVI